MEKFCVRVKRTAVELLPISQSHPALPMPSCAEFVTLGRGEPYILVHRRKEGRVSGWLMGITNLLGFASIVFGSFFAWGCGERQAFKMRDHFPRTRPPAEVKAKHLVRSFRRRAAHPETDEQTGNQRHLDLDLHSILTMTE